MSKTKFSPKKYIIEHGKKCPIHQCLVSDNYDDDGLTICLLIRKQPSGKYMFTSLMLDRLCLGVKQVFCNCNFDEQQLEELKERMHQNGAIEEVDPVYFHNLVYATVDFAAEIGFNPPQDFALAEKILDADLIDDGIDEIEVGDENDMPLFISGPYDDVDRIISTLNRNVGEGNYNYISMA